MTHTLDLSIPLQPTGGSSAHKTRAHSACAESCMEWMGSFWLERISVATAATTVGLPALKLGHKAILSDIDYNPFLGMVMEMENLVIS